MASVSDSPQAGIIGAGIAGLSAAIALRRAGWVCTLYERSSFKNEIGAALFINPPATRCFNRWGFKYDRAQPTENVTFITRKADDLMILGNEIYEGSEQVYGGKALIFHRVDLHKELLELATGKVGTGYPATVKLGCLATDVDSEEGIIRFEKGAEVRNDLVVIANGIHVSYLRLY